MRRRIELTAILAFLSVAALPAVSGEAPAPLDDHAWTDSSGKVFRFSQWQGRPLLVSLAYTSCPTICPMTMSHLRKLREQIADECPRAGFVVLSIDPAKDTPKRLREFQKRHHLTGASWKFLVAPWDQTQSLARKLGMGFAEVPSGSHVPHANDLALVGSRGGMTAAGNGFSGEFSSILQALKTDPGCR